MMWVIVGVLIADTVPQLSGALIMRILKTGSTVVFLDLTLSIAERSHLLQNCS